MRYSWKPPTYFVDQRIEFYDHRGTIHFGVIIYLETKYDYKGEAWHLYLVQPNNWKKHLGITEKSIIRAF